ncbi:unnamed protein product [Agarophyton chilense]
MPYPAATSARSAKRRHKKEIAFGAVEVIPDAAACIAPAASPSASSSSLSSECGYKLRRSPTPVLTSLTDLTHAHLFQLASVWQEASVPSFEQDRRDIAASRPRKPDPFDF